MGWEEQEREGKLFFKVAGADRAKSGVGRRSGRQETEWGRGKGGPEEQGREDAERNFRRVGKRSNF